MSTDHDAVERRILAVFAVSPMPDGAARSHARVAASMTQVPSRPRSGFHLRRSRGALLVAVGLLGLTVATAGAIFNGDPREREQVQAAIAPIFATGGCVTSDAAVQGITSRLATLPERRWAVDPGPGVKGSDCVAAVVNEQTSSVLLIRGESPDVVAAIGSIREVLMSRCLDKRAATDLIRSTLRGLGVDDAEIRTDGPLSYPSDERAAVERHIADGCVVYAGSGHTGNAKPIFYLAGPS